MRPRCLPIPSRGSGLTAIDVSDINGTSLFDVHPLRVWCRLALLAVAAYVVTGLAVDGWRVNLGVELCQAPTLRKQEPAGLPSLIGGSVVQTRRA